MTVPKWKNKLYFGDSLDILREHAQYESVDLIYLDPPFDTGRNFPYRARVGDEEWLSIRQSLWRDLLNGKGVNRRRLA